MEIQYMKAKDKKNPSNYQHKLPVASGHITCPLYRLWRHQFNSQWKSSFTNLHFFQTYFSILTVGVLLFICLKKKPLRVIRNRVIIPDYNHISRVTKISSTAFIRPEISTSNLRKKFFFLLYVTVECLLFVFVWHVRGSL